MHKWTGHSASHSVEGIGFLRYNDKCMGHAHVSAHVGSGRHSQVCLDPGILGELPLIMIIS